MVGWMIQRQVCTVVSSVLDFLLLEFRKRLIFL